MPSGDPQRTWFPEMIEMLRTKWGSRLDWDEIILLRDELDEMLQNIRAERNIHPPVINCPKCGKRHSGSFSKVSVRALILSLERFGIVSGREMKDLEKQWKKYRLQNMLDLYGKPETANELDC